jgi:hypothetical protein
MIRGSRDLDSGFGALLRFADPEEFHRAQEQ